MKISLLEKCLSLYHYSVFRSTGIYIGSSFLNALVPFLVMPILTRYLDPVDYGIVAMFTVLVTFVTPFTGLSIHGAVYRQYFDLEKKQMRIYITNALGIVLCSSLLVGLLFRVFSSSLESISSIPVFWIDVVVVVSMMNFLGQICLALFQVQEKPLNYGLFQNMKTIFNIGLSLFFVLIMGFSWQGRLLGISMSSILFGIVAIVYFWHQKWLCFSFNPTYIKNALHFGIPMIPTAIKGAIMTTIDRLFITNMVGVAFTGLYTVGYQLSIPIHLLTASFNNAYVPWLFKRLKLNDANINRKIVKYTYIYFASIPAIALSWTLIAICLLKFFVGLSFAGARPYIIWLSLGFAFSGMHSMIVNYIYFVQKTARYGIISIISVIINICLNYLLILKHGAVGAAQATCITFFLTFLMTWWLSSRVYPMPWFSFWKKEASL